MTQVRETRLRRIALFDLDGTLTRRDTLFPYLVGFSLRRPLRLVRLFARLPGALVHYAFKGRDPGRLKEELIIASLEGVTRAEIARWNDKYVPRLLARGMHAQALRQAATHRASGDYLVLMSASPDLYVPAIARALGFNETICTGVRWDGMSLSGTLATPNRRGEEKLHCVLALRQRHSDVPITAYGNAASDLAHLGACEHPYLVNGDPDAVREAARIGVHIGWPHQTESSRGTQP
ncbi:MAG TPA: HAD-IB family hydrolase [Steroidobacteraceae bacterium]